MAQKMYCERGGGGGGKGGGVHSDARGATLCAIEERERFGKREKMRERGGLEETHSDEFSLD